MQSEGGDADGPVSDVRQGVNAALQHHQAGRLSEAEAAYRGVLAVDSENTDALHFLGVIAYQRGKHEQAAEWISRALALNESNAPAHNNLGNAFEAQGRSDEAMACYRKAIALAPDHADAHINLGALLRARGELDEAIACYQRALLLSPENVTAHSNLGNVLRDQGRLDEATICYNKALALKPDFTDAHFNLGGLLLGMGRLNDAADCYRAAIAIRPDLPEAHLNLGNVLTDQGLLDEARAAYGKALALNPDFPEAYCNLGNALVAQGRSDEAVGCYGKALALKPDFAEAHVYLGNVFKDRGQVDEAVARYRTAVSLNSQYAEARWSVAMSQIPAIYEAGVDPEARRTEFSSELEELDRWFDSTRLALGFNAVGFHQPFYLSYQEQDNRRLLQRHGDLCARIMASWFARQGFSRPKRSDSDGTIRVGVVSPHFRNHSVWNAIVKGWFQQLDRKRFSIYAFDLGSLYDQETLFAKSHASHFEQGTRGFRSWVETIIDQRLDALIYTDIGMHPTVLKLACLRLAAVQVATWGHPETTGLPTVDYYLSAEDLEPADAQKNYSEQLVALPHLGCFYQPSQTVPAPIDLAGLGIDTDSPLLICPGVPFKYAPQHDRVLADIARGLGRCQFVFFRHHQRSMWEQLRKRLDLVFTRNGLDSTEFVVFIPWLERPAFFGLMKRADVFLDTIGFSGFNTAMQAMECGLPVVTREGRFLRGRLASGILKRMGLAELVAASEADYVELAVKLCRDPEYRGHLRGRIQAARSILFEDFAPIRALEEFLVGATRP